MVEIAVFAGLSSVLSGFLGVKEHTTAGEISQLVLPSSLSEQLEVLS